MVNKSCGRFVRREPIATARVNLIYTEMIINISIFILLLLKR